MVERNLAKVDVVGSSPIARSPEQVYNKGMVNVTGYDVIDDDKLFQFLKDAYAKNEDVLIPKELLKDFVQAGCRITICKEVFYKNK